jgi:hypothetical protein
MFVKVDCVAVSELCIADWKSGPTPNILEVKLLLFFFKFFKDCPEEFDNFTVLITTVVDSHLLKSINIKNLVPNCSDLNFFPGKDIENSFWDDCENSISNPLNLFGSFLKTSLNKEFNKLVKVLFGD